LKCEIEFLAVGDGTKAGDAIVIRYGDVNAYELMLIDGGHVRVGYEDNPYIAPGELAKNNAVLVERMVKIAQGLGRDVATPKEALKILGLARQ
jgi:uncharacterized protein (DUF849 family)